MLQELSGSGISKYVLLDSRVFTGQGFQLRHEEGVPDKSDIEEKIDIVGNAKLIPEGDQRESHTTRGSILTKLPDQQITQFMHCNAGRIDDSVRMLPKLAKPFAFES